MSREVILVPGKDIVHEAGGHASYARAMGHAAVAAGFTPHIFGVGLSELTLETSYGIVHRAPSPLRFVIRKGPGEGLRNRFMVFHQGTIRRRLEAFLASRSGRIVIHGLGPWGAIGLEVARRARNPDVEVVPIITAFTTMLDEHEGKRRGVSRAHGVAARVRAEVEYQWIKATTIPKDLEAITESTRVLVNYESVARQIREIPGHAPIEIVPYAAETAFEEPLALRPQPDILDALEPKDAPLVVAVSRHDSRKGLDLLLEALGRLRGDGIPFRACLVGPGPLLEVHRRLADTLGILDSTRLIGYAPDPMAYLQRADVYCLPSTQEGSGSVAMLEAMQAGRAIVASDVDGIPEDVTHEESAILAPPGDVPALAEALKRAITDEVLRNRLGQGARARFQARFSAEIFSRSVGDLYRELLQAPSAGG